MKPVKIISALVLGASLIAGCTLTETPSASNYSGWLSDYSNLTEVKTPTGGTSLRWINPAFQKGKYHAVIIENTTYYPQAQPSAQVGAGVLQEIPAYLKQQLVAQLGTELKVVQKAGPGVLRMKTAITGVDTPIENLQAYEYVPIGLVFAGISTAAGSRDHETVVYLEAQVTDSRSGDIIAKAVRKGVGNELQNKKAQVTLADVKPVLNDWAKDAALTLKAMQ